MIALEKRLMGNAYNKIVAALTCYTGLHNSRQLSGNAALPNPNDSRLVSKLNTENRKKDKSQHYSFTDGNFQTLFKN